MSRKNKINQKLDPFKIRKDFPIMGRDIEGSPLVYFDNAATSQKPKQVIDAITEFYSKNNANVHRGIHTLSENATRQYEESRTTLAKFLGANSPEELIFTNGTTHSVNHLSVGIKNLLSEGDEIITSNLEHHSNFVPWQRLCKERGAILKTIDITPEPNETSSDYSKKILDKIERFLSKKTKLVTISHVSNVTGSIIPIKEIASIVKGSDENILLLVDGAQSAPHIPINMRSLGCDFFVFSGHKMLGPMGIGGLWIRKNLMEKIEPGIVGGGMIEKVSLDKAVWAGAPYRYEAGTPNVAGAIGLAAAVKYLESVGMREINNHGRRLAKHTIELLEQIAGLKIIGPKDDDNRIGLISFYVEGTHPHDIAAILNSKGIAVRAGQHCAMPLHTELDLEASTRASFYLYNTNEEVDYFYRELKTALKVLK